MCLFRCANKALQLTTFAYQNKIIVYCEGSCKNLYCIIYDDNYPSGDILFQKQ